MNQRPNMFTGDLSATPVQVDRYPERNVSPVRLEPLVLKCPECGAPSELRAIECRFCHVPLSWAPAIPVDELQRPQTYEPPFDGDNLSIGPAPISGGAEQVFQLMPQAPFRPLILWVDPALAQSFIVTRIQIGMHLQQYQPEVALPCSLMAKGEGMRGLFKDESLLPGQMLSITVRNINVQACTFHALVRGHVFDSTNDVARALALRKAEKAERLAELQRQGILAAEQYAHHLFPGINR